MEESMQFASNSELQEQSKDARAFFEDTSVPFDSDEDCNYGSDCDYSIEESIDSETPRIPFWFSNEEPSHAKRIIKAYSRHLKITEPSVGNPRLIAPSFVGRIERQPVEYDEDDYGFTTLDVVKVYRRDLRQVGSTVTELPDHEAILLTKWDDDGVPVNFNTRATTDLLDWGRYKKFSKPSFIYCLPVWHNDLEFMYSVDAERKQVGYSKEPFNFTKYIPPHYHCQVNFEDT